MKIEDYILVQAAGAIRDAIAETGGNEVFFVGNFDSTQKIAEVETICRGGRTAVPVIMESAAKADAVIHNHPSGELQPSRNDISIASQLGQDGIGFYIVDNAAENIYVVVEPVTTRKKEKLDTPMLLQCLTREGKVGSRLAGFEPRPEQRRMIEAIVDAFNMDSIAMIEAGTGTGKSLAYLIPSVYWTHLNRERCVVSTNTINLQQQLFMKDLPFLNKALDMKTKFVLVKGRSNYLCLQKLAAAASNPESLLEEADIPAFNKVLEWAHKTNDGSRSDIPFQPTKRLWDQLCCDSDTCLGLKCPDQKKCFLRRARNEALTADILVVNHHILFADLSIRMATENFGASVLLPNYKRVIIDEAHNIEDAAASYFGFRVTHLGLKRLFHQFYRLKKNGKESGLLSHLSFKLRKTKLKNQFEDVFRHDLQPRFVNLDDQLDHAFDLFLKYLKENGKPGDNELKLRLIPDKIRESDWKNKIQEPFEQLLSMMISILNACKNINKILKKVQSEVIEFEALQFRSLTSRMNERITSLKTLLDFEEDESGLVRWFEGRPYSKTKFAALNGAPLEIGPILKNCLYDNFSTVVYTSATLSTGDQFEYMKKRLGLNLLQDRKTELLELPSSFDFKNQAMVCVPIDMPDPNSPQFSAQVAEACFKILELTKGRAFILFTSYRLLYKTFYALEKSLLKMNITPLRQGADDRHRLLDRFKKDVSSTLFGTDSFWEGVDAPGRTLECVILTKLPFRVPSEPIIEARVEDIEKKGGNPFMEFTVPQAVLKFRQGFGRLIRSKNDRGIIAIFDKRIKTKFYGARFIDSLPPCNIVAEPMDSILKYIDRFLNKRLTSNSSDD